MTQSSPIDAPAPIATWGASDVRAPIRTRAPMHTNGATDTSGPNSAVASMLARGLIPGAAAGAGVNTATASAKARYGCVVRNNAHGAACTDSSTMTADARVVARRAAYF